MVDRDGPALKVLVAEDEALAAMVLEDVLADSGYSVTVAPDGEVALRLARQHRFDVLITDLAMPRMTGWELLGSLAAEQPDLPVVVMTGYLPPGGREVLFGSGRPPLALLLKPFDIEQLLRVLARVPERQLGPARRAAEAMPALRALG